MNSIWEFKFLVLVNYNHFAGSEYFSTIKELSLLLP